jgi:hypothetical protein
LLFCHAFSNLQKTGINIDDLTHSMASDVQLWQIIGMDFGLQQTPKTPRQRSNRIPPGICQLIPQTNNKQSNAHSHVVCTPQSWQVQPTECQRKQSRKQKTQQEKSRNVVATRRCGEVTKCPTHWEDRKSRVNSFP